MAHIKPALRYAALAVFLGYTLEFGPDADPDPDLEPPESFRLRDVEVFDTARGWRVAVYGPDGMMLPTKDSDFFHSLKKALQVGAERARMPVEADKNPLLPHLRAVLRQRQDGDVGNGRNPYCDETIKAALKAIKEVTGSAANWMDVNEKR